ncbi:MAG TPA: hypothetical protein VI756_08935 [Blastocatellia bacterium]
MPQLKEIPGYLGGYVLRRDGDQESEFVVINLFESLEAVRAFAGENYEIAIFEPEAKLLLSRIEPEAVHYDVRADTT